MAAPTPVGGPPPTLGGAAQSTSGTLATGIPAGMQNNDIVIVFAENHQPTSVGTISWPSGFAEIFQVQMLNSSGTALGTVGMAWRRSDGTDSGAAAACTRSGDTGTDSHFLGNTWAIRGCKTSGDPYDVVATLAENAQNPQHWPDITTLTADSFVVTGRGLGGVATNYATPASWSVASSNSGTSGTDGSFDTDYRTVATPTTINPGNTTTSIDADGAYVTFQVAFIPPGAGSLIWQPAPSSLYLR